jgi:hypothetical protein
MTDFKENLEKMFNIAEESPKKDNLPATIEKTSKADESHDFAQTKLKKYIEIGENVLNEAESVAVSTGEPQAVAAFTNLLKTLGVMSTDYQKTDTELAKVDKIHKDIDRKDAIKSIVNNNMIVFTGTTSDLLKEAKKKQLEDITIEGSSTVVEEEK